MPEDTADKAALRSMYETERVSNRTHQIIRIYFPKHRGRCIFIYVGSEA
jgi:hypothetical protein